MTHTESKTRRRRSSVWPITAWLLVLASALVLGVGISGEVLASSLVLDLVSFWPGLVVAFLLAAALWPLFRRRAARLGAILPLLLLTWMWGGVALHFAEWDLLPSSSVDLRGPPIEHIQAASLTLTVGGPATVGPDSDALYSVRPERRGGMVGVPQAIERLEGDFATVAIFEAEPGRWFGWAGWRITLAGDPRWTLSLTAESVDADLTGHVLERLEVHADGVVRLPSSEVDTPVVLEGDLVVVVPAGVGVTVTGAADVPSEWEVTDTGWRSPGRAPGYSITVAEGSRVRIIPR